MRRDLLAATARNGGVISREMALAIAPRHVVADTVTDGALERMFPRVYALPEVVNQLHVRRHGALLFLPDAALSHVDALATWDVPGEAARPDEPIHLTRPGDRSNVKVRGLEVHRRKAFAVETPLTVIRHGARVVRLE